ncbi:hypothetical protein C8R45DRAFT_809050 [Mycena sanguinolenta]|nr:hypothetical protein C8R45DRAFT_809050 [Mycena sanguinolenta]
MSPPPAKRKRTALKKHSEFWLSDGSVVLQAGNTLFRVHWSVLARHSSVFSDMQELPQPSDEPTVDGCPVLKLPDDPKDVEFLLKGLYDATFHSQEIMSLPVLGALIRLGRKYDFRDLLDSAVARVTAEYPTTLAEYDAMTGRFKTIEAYPGIELDMVTLLSENNIWSALPCACYRIVQENSLEYIFDGKLRDDESRASLSQIDLRRCAIGLHTLSGRLFEPGYTLGWALEWEPDGCTSPAVCRGVCQSIVAAHVDETEVHVFLPPTFLARCQFCSTCARYATDSMAAGRKQMWEDLPEIFDLPSWHELKNDL